MQACLQHGIFPSTLPDATIEKLYQTNVLSYEACVRSSATEAACTSPMRRSASRSRRS